jgi:orotate phosphoribosyltransferase
MTLQHHASKPYTSDTEEEDVHMHGANFDFVDSTAADVAARTLLQGGAYLFSPMEREQFYEWKSGIRAPVYTDCRVLQGRVGPSQTLVRSLANSIETGFSAANAIAGMAEAGLAWSAPVAYALGLPHATVRKHAKAHGRSRMVEGCLSAGALVVLVDDLMAGGGTAANAIQLIEGETQAHVIGVLTIVNWNFSEMRERFAALGVPYRALTSYPHILEAAVASGVITSTAAQELKAFYRNPRHHEWDLAALTPPPASRAGEVR